MIPKKFKTIDVKQNTLKKKSKINLVYKYIKLNLYFKNANDIYVDINLSYIGWFLGVIFRLIHNEYIVYIFCGCSNMGIKVYVECKSVYYMVQRT